MPWEELPRWFLSGAEEAILIESVAIDIGSAVDQVDAIGAGTIAGTDAVTYTGKRPKTIITASAGPIETSLLNRQKMIALRALRRPGIALLWS
jgi:hypothetical protein